MYTMQSRRIRKKFFNITRKNNKIKKAKLSKINFKKWLLENICVFKLDPNYITGLAQSDGTFFVSIARDRKAKWGPRFRPSFAITQKHLLTKSVLRSIQRHFKCGNIYYNKGKKSWEYVVDSKDELPIIFNHFETYPLHVSKQRSFHIVKLITEMLRRRDHYNKDKLAFMIKLIYKINAVTNRDEQKERELFEELELNYIEDKYFNWDYEIKDYPINDQFLIGLIEGDGSFFITFHRDLFMRPGFNISQSSTEKVLLDKVEKYLGCGEVQEESETVIKYRINNFDEIIAHLIPFMDKYQLYTKKRDHYTIFKKVCMIKGNRDDRIISLEDKFKIVDLAYNMNKGGAKRKMTKEEYIRTYFPEAYWPK